jgi:hypothetical protein
MDLLNNALQKMGINADPVMSFSLKIIFRLEIPLLELGSVPIITMLLLILGLQKKPQTDLL